MDRRVSAGVLWAASASAALAPALRLLPASASGPLAVLFPLAAGLLMLPLFSAMGASAGFGAALERSFGQGAGRTLSAIAALWLMYLLAGRFRGVSGGFLTEVYPEAPGWLFSLSLAILAALLPAKKLHAFLICAAVMAPVMIALLLICVLLALPELGSVDTGLYTPDAWTAALTLWGVPLAAAAIAGDCERERGLSRPLVRAVLYILLLGAVQTAVVGTFGLKLTSVLQNPFLSMVKSLSALGFLEHMEALAAALLVAADLSCVGLLALGAARLLQTALPAIKNRVVLLPAICAAALLASALPKQALYYPVAAVCGPVLMCLVLPALTALKARKSV